MEKAGNRMRGMIAVVAGALLVASLMAADNKKQQKGTPSPAAKKSVSFKNQVAPVIRKNCLPCHTEDQMNPSELYLDSYEGLMKGGKHGSPVVAGKPDSSLLIQKLGAKPPFGDPMPLKRKTPLGADTVSVLKRWIQQGAKNN